MNMGWLEDFIFQAWCDGECFVGNMKFSRVSYWEYFALLESSWWNLMKILDECDAMFGLVWMLDLGFVCSNQGWIVVIKFPC